MVKEVGEMKERTVHVEDDHEEGEYRLRHELRSLRERVRLLELFSLKAPDGSEAWDWQKVARSERVERAKAVGLLARCQYHMVHSETCKLRQPGEIDCSCGMDELNDEVDRAIDRSQHVEEEVR
jgi:hypothetical protein